MTWERAKGLHTRHDGVHVRRSGRWWIPYHASGTPMKKVGQSGPFTPTFLFGRGAEKFADEAHPAPIRTLGRRGEDG